MPCEPILAAACGFALGHQPLQKRSSGGLPCQHNEQYTRLLRIGLPISLHSLPRCIIAHAWIHRRRVSDAAPEAPVTCSHGLASCSKPEI